MKYPCCMIQDLLPLFHDGVCSDDTADIVREHLRECEDCRTAYDALCAAEIAPMPEPGDWAEELKKADSLRRLRRWLSRRSLASRMLALLLLIALCAVGYAWNEHGEMTLPCDESMHVYFDESGDLVLQGDLRCSVVSISQILVSAEVDGEVEDHIFVRYYVKPLDYLLCSLLGNRVDSTYVLAFSDKGAAAIDGVHYCTKDFDSNWFGGGDLTADQMQLRIDASVTLWEK